MNKCLKTYFSVKLETTFLLGKLSTYSCITLRCKKKGILPNFKGLAISYETILSSVAKKSFRSFYTELF